MRDTYCLDPQNRYDGGGGNDRRNKGGRRGPKASQQVLAAASLEDFVELSAHPIDWTEAQLRSMHAHKLRLLCRK
jgi:hypothetical protein